MRPALEQFEKVEKYILGELTPSELLEFEAGLEQSAELREMVEFQQDIIQTNQRIALRKEIALVAATAATVTPGKSFWRGLNGFLTIAVIAVLATTVVLAVNGFIGDSDAPTTQVPVAPTTRQPVPSLNTPQGPITTSEGGDWTSRHEADLYSTPKTEEYEPWVPFNEQTFGFNAENGGLFEGKDGSIVVVPEGALLDSLGNQVTGPVNFSLIEALSWEDMIAYNLTTTNEGKALSSGGMVRVQFTQNGEELRINPNRPLHIEIPTDNYDSSMQAWEGVVTNGEINWENPRDLKGDLTPVNFDLLDFLPEGFEEEVATALPYKQYTEATPELVDSLYYSLKAPKQYEDIMMTSPEVFESPIRVSNVATGLSNALNVNYAPQQKKVKHKKFNLFAWFRPRRLYGKVTDRYNKPIEGATITVRRNGKIKGTARTNSDGVFNKKRIPRGQINLSATFDHPDSGQYIGNAWTVYPRKGRDLVMDSSIIMYRRSNLRFQSGKMAGGSLQIKNPWDGPYCFVDPLSIKTMKSEEFANTFIATKEFEERVKAIHALRNGQAILDIYLNNLDRDLWVCDQMAANRLTGKDAQTFDEFASQKLTNVPNGGIHARQLKAFYDEKRRKYQKELDEVLKKYDAMTIEELQKISDEFGEAKDLIINGVPSSASLQSASGRNIRTSVAVKQSYRTNWYSSGWMNIDKYRKQLGANPLIVSMSVTDELPGTRVYQCINPLKTIVRLTEFEGTYEARFPNKITRQTGYCLAFAKKGDQLYYDQKRFNVKSLKYTTFELAPVTAVELKRKIKKLSPSTSDLAKDLDSEIERINHELEFREKQKRLQEELEKELEERNEGASLRNRLIRFINNCQKPTV